MIARILLGTAILFLFSFSGDKRRSDVLVKNDIFTIHYSEVYEQPLSVSYTVSCTDGNFSRKGLDFFTCDSIHTSDDQDYYNNDYDKGHMAPAADFSCDNLKLKKTFTYLNCALQHYSLNRGVWKELETRERSLAANTKTTVLITVHFSKSSKVLQTGATVPDGFTKTIKSGKIKETYYFPNIKIVDKELAHYKKK